MRKVFTLLAVFCLSTVLFAQENAYKIPKNMQADAFELPRVGDQRVDGPDLVSIPTGFVTDYYQVPLEQVSFTVDAYFGNVGNMQVSPTVKPTGYIYDYPNYAWGKGWYLPALDTNEYIKVKTESFNNVPVGDYTFVAGVSLENDVNKNNNAYLYGISVTENILSRDNGIVKDTFSIPSAGYVLNKFELNLADTLNAVHFYQFDSLKNTYNATVWRVDEDGYIREKAKSLPYTTDSIGLQTATFGAPLVMEPGLYYIGIQQKTAPVELAVTSTNYKKEDSYLIYGGGLYYGTGTYYIRPEFSSNVTKEIEFIVTDSVSNSPVVDAKVYFDGYNSVITDAEGKAKVLVNSTVSKYYFGVVKDNFEVYEGVYGTDTTTIVNVVMVNTYVEKTIDFVVVDSALQNAITGASVTVGDLDAVTTDDEGKAQVVVNALVKEYNYTVSLEDYITVNGAFGTDTTTSVDIVLVYNTVEEDLAAQMQLYPNPANNQITVKGLSINKVVVYNAAGVMVNAVSFGGENEVVLQVADLENGVYFIGVETNKGTAMHKVIKQ